MKTLNLHFEEWSMDNNMVGKIWVGMCTIEIHLFQFKIQSYFEWRYRTHTEEKPF